MSSWVGISIHPPAGGFGSAGQEHVVGQSVRRNTGRHRPPGQSVLALCHADDGRTVFVAGFFAGETDVVEIISPFRCFYDAGVAHAVGGIGVGIRILVFPLRRVEPTLDIGAAVDQEIVEEENCIHSSSIRFSRIAASFLIAWNSSLGGDCDQSCQEHSSGDGSSEGAFPVNVCERLQLLKYHLRLMHGGAHFSSQALVFVEADAHHAIRYISERLAISDDQVRNAKLPASG